MGSLKELEVEVETKEEVGVEVGDIEGVEVEALIGIVVVDIGAQAETDTGGSDILGVEANLEIAQKAVQVCILIFK